MDFPLELKVNRKSIFIANVSFSILLLLLLLLFANFA